MPDLQNGNEGRALDAQDQMTEETDVAVVGAGGGGAVLALALARKASGPSCSIRLRDPQKDCGANSSAERPTILDRLGVLPCHRTRHVRSGSSISAGLAENDSVPSITGSAAPYNRAIVTLPNVAHHAIVDAVNRQPTVSFGTARRFSDC